MKVKQKKGSKSEAKAGTSMYLSVSVIAQMEAEAHKFGCGMSQVWEKAALHYLGSGESVSTTPFEKRFYTMELLRLNCGHLKNALDEPIDGDILQYFRHFFSHCMQNADGKRVKSADAVDKEKEMSVFLLIEELKVANTDLYDKILGEMGNYGRLRDRYLKLLTK